MTSNTIICKPAALEIGNIQRPLDKVKVYAEAHRVPKDLSWWVSLVFVLHCTYTGDCSNSDRARYEAQAIIHADVESGRPGGKVGKWMKDDDNLLYFVGHPYEYYLVTTFKYVEQTIKSSLLAINVQKYK